MNTSRLMLSLLGFGLAMSCSNQATKPSPTRNARVTAPPTATEVFNLRSKCAELGEKIMERNIIGSALTQSQVSHYDAETNRCYVELDVNTGDLTKFDDYYSRTLFDGQTGEMLAHIENKKGQRTAFVKDGPNTLDY